jgi:hypothetical protein
MFRVGVGATTGAGGAGGRGGDAADGAAGVPATEGSPGFAGGLPHSPCRGPAQSSAAATEGALYWQVP